MLSSLKVRTFNGIEDLLDTVEYTTFDGKNRLEPQYSPES
jgi:hypothetical protein